MIKYSYNDMLLEGKLEDFIKDNSLSKEEALSDDNINKLKKLLKLNADKTKAKVEKYFNDNSSDTNDSSTDENKEQIADVPADIQAEVDKLPEEKKTLFKSLMSIIGNAAKNYATNQAGKLLDELMLGNFKDAVIGVYEKELKSKLDSEETINSTMNELKEFDGYKKAEKNAEANSKKDTETETTIDESSAKFMAQWYSSNKEENIGKQLSDLVRQIQEAAKKLEDDTKKMKAEFKKAKIDLSDEDIANYGPALAQMLSDKLSPEDMKKTVDELKKNIKESMRSNVLKHYGGNTELLKESKYMISESLKNQFLFESICENDILCEAITERMIMEGWFGDAAKKALELAKKGAKATGLSSAAEKLADVSKQVGSKLADASKKGMEACTKYSIGPMLSLAGIGVGVLTGGWGAELIIKTMDLIEKNGKQLKNSFERVMNQIANSKGVITKMDYSLTGDKNKTYSMRFYEKDMVWRVLNTKDQLKHPSKEYVKQIVNGEIGKKYRNRLKSIWDPVFSEAKGGKIDFVKLFEQAKNVDIPEKALQDFQKFADNYDRIVSDCIESPKIDTRAQSMKKD